MGFYFDKQPSSRVIKTQTIAYTGAGTAVSTNFTPQTYQLRISRCARIRRKLCYLKRLGGGWPGGPTRRCKRASGKKQSGPFQSSSARARRPDQPAGKWLGGGGPVSDNDIGINDGSAWKGSGRKGPRYAPKTGPQGNMKRPR